MKITLPKKEPRSALLFIPKNSVMMEWGYCTHGNFVALLRKYKRKSTIVQFLADMLE